MIDYAGKQMFEQSSNIKLKAVVGSVTHYLVNISDFKMLESLMSTDTFELGCCESASIEYNTVDNALNKGDVVQLKLEIEGYDDFNLCEMVVDSITPSESKRTVNVKMFDKLYYILAEDFTDWYNNEFGNADSIALSKFVNDLFAFIGLSKDLNLPNLAIYKVEGSITGATILNSLNGLLGGFGHICRDGIFRVIKPNLSVDMYVSNITSNRKMYASCNYEDFSVKSFSDAGFYVYDFGSDLPTVVHAGDNPYSIKNNIFITNTVTQGINLNDIYNLYKDFSYVPLKSLSVLGNPCYEVGDTIEIELDDGAKIKTIMFERELINIIGMRDEITSNGTEYPIEENNDLVAKIEQLNSALNVKIEKTANGIRTEVSETYVTNETYEDTVEDLQSQIDGDIQTWTSNPVPTLSNYPANEWTTEEERSSHVGDLYYDENNYCYRFRANAETYEWVKLQDTDVSKAVGDAASAKETAESVQDDLSKNYSTTVAMNSAIEQSASAITSTVSKTYQTKTQASEDLSSAKTYADGVGTSTLSSANSNAQSYANTAEKNAKDDTTEKLKSYSTTTEVKSLISQESGQILIEVSETYATQDDLDDVQEVAEGAVSTANSASNKADSAVSTANSADGKAGQAVTTANTANETASEANTKAGQAVTTANSANGKAEQAVTTAGQADTKAGNAVATASEANTKAGNAVATANSANNKADGIISSGEQLVINGSAVLQNNYNFSRWKYDGSKANGSGGSFTKDGTSDNEPKTDLYFPVNPDNAYRIQADAMSKNELGTLYMFPNFYDIDKLEITAQHHMYQAGTLTTLARDLKNGDTVIYLTDASNWNTNSGLPTHRRSIIIWNYTNSKGYTYPELTYSRIWFQDLWADGGINKTNNTITLKTAWDKGTYIAGTKLSQGNSGAAYKYSGWTGNVVPKEWTTKQAIINGIDYSGTNAYYKFPPATAFCKIGFLWNYERRDDKIWATNIAMYEDYKTPDVVETLYFCSSGSKPPKPTSRVTKTSDVKQEWTLTPATWDSNYRYYFTCTQTTNSVGETTWTEVITDNSLSRSISQILVNADGITQRVQKGTIISEINQSAESVSIDASKINLNGAVTANNYFKINEDGSMETIAGKIANFDISENVLTSTIISDVDTPSQSSMNLINRRTSRGTEVAVEGTKYTASGAIYYKGGAGATSETATKEAFYGCERAYGYGTTESGDERDWSISAIDGVNINTPATFNKQVEFNNVSIKEIRPTWDLTKKPSSTEYRTLVGIYDKNNTLGGQVGSIYGTDGSVTTYLQSRNSTSQSSSLGVKFNADNSSDLVFGGHIVGERLSASTSSSVSVSANSTSATGLTSLVSLTLTAGTYVAQGNVQFGSNASGYRVVAIASSKSETYNTATRVPTISGIATFVSKVRTFTLTSTTTINLYVRHTGSASLSCVGSLEAVRII